MRLKLRAKAKAQPKAARATSIRFITISAICVLGFVALLQSIGGWLSIDQIERDFSVVSGNTTSSLGLIGDMREATMSARALLGVIAA